MSQDIIFTPLQGKDLEKSGIDAGVAIDCGLRNEDDQEILSGLLRWDAELNIGSSLLIPYYPVGDDTQEPLYYRVKPDKPFKNENGTMKYLQPLGVPADIYIPPNVDREKLKDANTPLFLTEGEKKAIKLNQEGFLAVAGAGVWNFHDAATSKTEKELKPSFEGIALQGRKCFITFDVKEFEKQSVLSAKLALANMLDKRGAQVMLVHLSEDQGANTATSDLGVDDFICRFGVERFKNVVEKAYRYPLMYHINEIPKDVELKELRTLAQNILRYYSVSKDEVDRQAMTKFLTKRASFSKTDINKSEKRFKESGSRQDEVKQNDIPTIIWTSETTFNQRCTEISNILFDSNQCQKIGNIPVFISQKTGNTHYLGTTDALSGLVSECMEFCWIDDEGRLKYSSPPVGDLGIFLNRPSFQERLPEIVAIVDHPVFNEHFELCEQGYDADTKIYTLRHNIVPLEGTEHVMKLIDDAHYANDGSKINRLGGLLSVFFPIYFCGKKPVALVTGNQKGIGKTYLARVDAIVRTGKITCEISFTPDDDALEKQLATAVLQGASEILIDNAKTSTRVPEIGSAVLERSITAQSLNFRILGKSKFVTRPNTGFFAITANSPKVSQDIISRSMSINLFCEGDPNKLTFTIQDPIEYALQHRSLILGELLGMIERWRAAGRPLANIEFRFREFAQIIGGILKVNGFEGFLKNVSQAEQDLSSEYDDLVTLFNAHPKLEGKPKDFAEKAVFSELFKSDIAGKKGSGLHRAMATILTKNVGKTFELEDDKRVVLASDFDSKTKSNVFRLVAVPKQDDQIAS